MDIARGILMAALAAPVLAWAAQPVAFSGAKEAGGVFEVAFDAGTNKVVGAEFVWQADIGTGIGTKRVWQRRPVENFDPAGGRIQTFVPTDAIAYYPSVTLADGRAVTGQHRTPRFRQKAQEANFVYAATNTVPKVYTNATGKVLRYRWHAPKTLEPGRRYPLVVFLHGAGERGSDNVRQFIHGVPQILRYADRTHQPLFLVAGQVPGGKHPTDRDGNKWVQVPWSGKSVPQPAEPSDSMAALIDLIGELRNDPAVDATRIYVTGLSMGGYGTWDLAMRRPSWFAAAMPLCGGTDDTKVALLKDVPMWVFHGASDNCVLPSRSKDAVAALEKAGGHVRLTVYEGVGHDCWTPTYGSDEVLAWFFAQRRPSAGK